MFWYLKICFLNNQFKKTTNFGDFPGGPVAKTPCSQCRGLGSIPGQGTRSQMAATKRPGTAK